MSCKQTEEMLFHVKLIQYNKNISLDILEAERDLKSSKAIQKEQKAGDVKDTYWTCSIFIKRANINVVR